MSEQPSEVLAPGAAVLRRATCPACGKTEELTRERGTLGNDRDVRPACTSCGAPFVIGGLYVVDAEGAERAGADVADGVTPLQSGTMLTSGTRVLVRVASAAERARVEREARIVRGLKVHGVPKLKDERSVEWFGHVLVVEHPGGTSLERALEQGLRTDAAGGRRFLDALLEILVALHGLSPPVFHRHVNPHAVFVDGDLTSARTKVSLVDFARATDVKDDVESDPVLARQGYAPRGKTSPVAQDLYGAAATTVHLLTRTPLERLAHDDDGAPRFRESANVDDALAHVLDRMLGVRGTRPFASAEEALFALRGVAPPRRASRGAPLVALAVVVVVALGGVVGFLSSRATSEPVPVAHHERAPVDVERAPAPVDEGAARDDGRDDEVPAARALEERAPVEQPTSGERARRPTRPPPTTTRDTPPPSADLVRLAALRHAVESREGELAACARPGDDRFRFTVAASEVGRVTRATPRDKTHAPSTLCVLNALAGVRFENASGRAFTSELTVYVAPSFRVTAF